MQHVGNSLHLKGARYTFTGFNNYYALQKAKDLSTRAQVCKLLPSYLGRSPQLAVRLLAQCVRAKISAALPFGCQHGRGQEGLRSLLLQGGQDLTVQIDY